jgi:hypothetical protein
MLLFNYFTTTGVFDGHLFFYIDLINTTGIQLFT